MLLGSLLLDGVTGPTQVRALNLSFYIDRSKLSSTGVDLRYL